MVNPKVDHSVEMWVVHWVDSKVAKMAVLTVYQMVAWTVAWMVDQMAHLTGN